MVDNALDHAERGYHVFACRPRGKEPLTRHGFKDASRDERTIRHMWDGVPDANVAAACGASGINVLDIDSKAGADPREVTAELDLEAFPTVLTGEAPHRCPEFPGLLSGERGAQVFLRGSRRTENTKIKGVELRGVGAYVVLAPSVHPSGVQYRGELPAVNRLPEIPATVTRILKDQARGQTNPYGRVARDAPRRHRPAAQPTPSNRWAPAAPLRRC